MLYHIYADDTQLYLSFQIGNLNQSRIKVESCIVAIKQWMSDNMLKLNDDKTQFLVGTGNRSRTYKFNIQVGDHMIHSSSNARNLGVIFDSHLDMHEHITRMCRATNVSSAANLHHPPVSRPWCCRITYPCFHLYQTTGIRY